MDQDCIPADVVYTAQLGQGANRWSGNPSIMENLKDKARSLGLWNMFLPKDHFREGVGLSALEYGLIAEQLGRSRTASEVRVHCVHIVFKLTKVLLQGLQLCCSRHWQHGGSR